MTYRLLPLALPILTASLLTLGCAMSSKPDGPPPPVGTATLYGMQALAVDDAGGWSLQEALEDVGDGSYTWSGKTYTRSQPASGQTLSRGTATTNDLDGRPIRVDVVSAPGQPTLYFLYYAGSPELVLNALIDSLRDANYAIR
jgi:hypothetical protein